MLLARIHVKPGCVDAYLELARATDAAVQASEPGMIHLREHVVVHVLCNFTKSKIYINKFVWQ
jgi:hypothetical protein